MIDRDELKQRIAAKQGEDFPLIFWEGTGRVVHIGENAFSALVRGKRAVFTWDRVLATWDRLRANHTLSADELGGLHDGVGLVSLFAFVAPQDVLVDVADGLLWLRSPDGQPVHQYAPMVLPSSWALLQRKLAGD